MVTPKVTPFLKVKTPFSAWPKKKKKSMDSVIFVRLSILPLGIKNKREHKDKHDCVTVTDRIFFFVLENHVTDRI